MNLIEKNSKSIESLCIQHKVKTLFVFGSVLTPAFKRNSDVDLIVDFQDVNIYDYADNYFSFKQALEYLFKRKVELLEEKAVKNPYLLQSIDSSKQQIYGF